MGEGSGLSMTYPGILVQTLVFPGLAFTAAVGLFLSWVDRKVTARVQMRQGPPLLQPFYDVAKYFVKETCIPAGATLWVFLAAPLVGLAGATVASTMIGGSLLDPSRGYVGDLIVVIYLLVLPSLAVIMGAFSSGNPLASVGGSREMKLLLSYELPFILALVVPILNAGSIRLGDIAATVSIARPSGVLALLVALICMQGKLGLVPFDLPEAETELTGGALIEYSGAPMGIFRLTRNMLLYVLPLFLVTAFCGPVAPGGMGVLRGVICFVVLVVLITLIRNTAPRFRTDHAVRFFWGPVSVTALAAVALHALGW